MLLDKKIINLQKKILTEMQKVNEGSSDKSIFQLQLILKELYAMEKSKGFFVSYPRIIIDSWDYTDTLGTELIEVAGLYKKVKSTKNGGKI